VKLREQIEVDADLMVVPVLSGDGTPRKTDWERARMATPEDLENLGYRHRDFMYRKLRDLFDQMDLDPEDDRVSIIRYFIELVTHYDHDMEDDDVRNVKAIITGEGKVKL
jgi:hypothetical protein